MLVNMVRVPGEHLERKEVKTEIIKIVLSNSRAVKEPEIRRHLEAKYGIIDESNIRRHLKTLGEDPYSCIEKIQIKRERANYWDVKTIENLKKILFHFPEILLNKYDKSLDIVVKKSSDSLFFPEPAMFKNQLAYSVSLFNICLEHEPETLYAQTMLIYRFGTGFEEYQTVKKYLIGLSSLYLKYRPNVEISEEIFLTMPGKWSREVLAGAVEILPEELFEENIHKIVNLLSFFKEEYLWSLVFVFEHYVNNDILIGSLSPVEIESSFRAKDKCILYRTELKINLRYSEANKILSNLSLNSENLDNCIDASATELATGWIEFHKCWLEEYKKFLEFENEFEELNKELKKLEEEYQRAEKVKQDLIKIIRKACKESKMLDEENSDFFAEVSKKLQKIREENEKRTTSIPFPELAEITRKLFEESAKLDEEISEFASKSLRFKGIFEKSDDLNKKIHNIKKMRRDNLIRRLRGLKS